MPVELDPGGLMNALQDLADQTERMLGINCVFQCDDEVLVQDSTTATQLYRITQEAVHNAVKHAQPTRIDIALYVRDGLRLTVQDDGCGWSRGATEHGGAGLRIMQHRARIIGGHLDVESDVGRGTTVTCTVTRAEQ